MAKLPDIIANDWDHLERRFGSQSKDLAELYRLKKKIVSLAASSRELFQVENSLFGGFLEGSSGVAEWLRCGALVCITTEGSLVRIALAPNFFAFLFLLLFSIANAFVHCQIKATQTRGPQNVTGAK